jgi:multiple sugar transport system permease protein
MAFIAYPLIEIVRISFTGWHFLKPGSDTFVGFDTYAQVLSDPLFLRIMGNTVLWMIMGTAFSLVLGMAIGYFLSFEWRINRFLRAVIIIPWILPPVVSATIWKWMMHGKFGVINDILMRMHIIDQGIPWLGQISTAFFAVNMVLVWKNVPLVALLLSAAFQGVPVELVEAGTIDGANAWTRFWRIIFPGIKTTFLVVAIIVSIWCIQQFVIIWMTTQGGPVNATHILPTYIFEMFTQSYHFGKLGVLSIVNLLILIGITLVYLRIFRKDA